ncbi:Nop14-like protein [Bimuria novae-zelandiae CBS 107.79]|uniref:Nop14-like protein n=1 Tax=Bimuria novae-zelandiae CBS 107.79 TaxID=1447943 RepID=A0A6A5VII2_9PLEO|nr:Nop14-like protein [Bimuria novae-zelandiae CBS 107.79]
MPPSQLKLLKTSLREQGFTGPQKSKKQKKSQPKNADQAAKKAAALASIRESFNPFEFKHLSRPKKHEYVSNNPQDAKTKILGRPGVTKSQGEETRRKTLLPEMSKRNKTGGILDRRIGEDDMTMSLEDKMMARFEREQQRKRGGNVFDLEDGDDDLELTHGGKSLRFDEDDLGKEDYDAASVSGSSSDGDEDGFLKRKRRRDSEGEEVGDAPEEEQPERKKSKAEVMKEVIAKSKQHKYERQQLKEDDDELREELDKDLNDVLAALRGHMSGKPPVKEPPKDDVKPNHGINPDRAALLAGKPRDEADKEYDARVRKMLYDQRSKPTERTKTEEEKAKEEAEKLKALEEKRMRRMRGEPTSDDEEPQNKGKGDEAAEEDAESVNDDAAEFGLGAPLPQKSRPEGVEDEDDFLLEDDLIASDSDADISDEGSEEEIDADDTMAADEDDDFLKSVLPEKTQPSKATNDVLTLVPEPTSKLAYTYSCPRSHEELLKVFKDVGTDDVPTVVQRIRALYHAGLHADNKDKLADFGCAVVDHIAYLSNQTPPAPLAIRESITRHVHSLSRSYPATIATRFREHLKALLASNNPTQGDLTILTAIGSIYPTSDHFHQVVTPAITLMARWLGLQTPASQKDVAIGAFLGTLCLHYLRLSKRYIPEFVRYTALCLKSQHTTPVLLAAHAQNILTASDLWAKTPAFIEIFTPILASLEAAKPSQSNAIQRLTIVLQNARLHRRPQLLHNHRPLPIKSSIPKFEEDFDPNKHYDPDKERAEQAKLRKEYKRERKGAMRELRKDANFVAREKLKDKRERDRAHAERERRLIAEIQGEEGKEKKEYEREVRKRKRG